MESFQPHKIFPCLLLPFLLQFSSLFFRPFADYTLPDRYFINCGSASNLTVHGSPTFIGDVKSDVVPRHSSPVEDRSSSTSVSDELYRSARIFRKPSSYELYIEQNGTYVVRFHFFPFSALGNLSDARFSVEASRFRVLSNFSVQNSSSSNFPRVEEFFVTVPLGKLQIKLVPDGDHSFAFVNAMEVFLAPPDFIPDHAIHVTREGEQPDGGRLSSALRVIHRINVGGSDIGPNGDSLLRNWTADDVYLLNNETSKKSEPVATVNYRNPISTKFVAPDSVYNTARELDDSSQGHDSNISWGFDVKKGATHLVRVHFCDIVSNTTNENLTFNLFVYTKFSVKIRPYSYFPQTAVPFYDDYVVDSDNSGFMNISVGPRKDSSYNPTAFLNGIEIMELIVDQGSSPGASGSTRKRLLIVVGSSVGGLVLVLLLTVLFLVLRKRKWKPSENFDWPLTPLPGGSSHSRTTVKTGSSSHLADLNLGLKLPFSEILYATKNFDTKLKIGEGGFGAVYKGMLRNGNKIAVKRSKPGHGQGLLEFQTEILVLSKIRHNHLVSLIGYCDERHEMILVYEFMERGSLRDHLYVSAGESMESASRPELSWDQRLRICIGAAKGLLYLHAGCNKAIIHRDIKSTNILIDEHYVAKVADFGLSRSGPPDQTHVSTDVKGSFGYLDPEYFTYLQLTQKSDVYSFGVVLLEVLCARPAINSQLPREQVCLAEWGMTWQRKGQLEKIVDPLLAGKIDPDSLRKFGEIVEKCLKDHGADRPNMVDVLWDLEYCLQLQYTAMPREPYEDSTTDVSSGLHTNFVQRLPSHSVPDLEEDQLSHESDGSSGTLMSTRYSPN